MIHSFVLRLLGMFLVGCLFMGATRGEDRLKAPSILYLTWIHDPSTTMTVQWHSKDTETLSEVSYRKVGESDWQVREGVFNPLPKTKVLVHTVEMDELEPNTDYQFSLVGREWKYLFRTLPKSLTRSVKFVIGGDA